MRWHLNSTTRYYNPGIFPHIMPPTAGDELLVGAHIPPYSFSREVASFKWDKGRHLDTNCRYEEFFRI